MSGLLEMDQLLRLRQADALDLVDRGLDVHLAHARDLGLLGLGVADDADRGVLLGDPVQRLAELDPVDTARSNSCPFSRKPSSMPDVPSPPYRRVVLKISGEAFAKSGEFGIDPDRTVWLRQQGTYAPDSAYRWMASPAMDRNGNIGIGYSFGGTPHYAGQRFAGRLADDPLGMLTLQETVLVEGEDAQTNTLRWQDYTQTAVDPVDDCTIWYVGDYIKAGAETYSTRIGAFVMPGCLEGS